MFLGCLAWCGSVENGIPSIPGIPSLWRLGIRFEVHPHRLRLGEAGIGVLGDDGRHQRVVSAHQSRGTAVVL